MTSSHTNMLKQVKQPKIIKIILSVYIVFMASLYQYLPKVRA